MSILEEIRVNRTPTHMVRTPSLTLSKEARQSMGKYTEREKQPGEVKQAENDLWQRPVYRSGDGDSMRQVPRAGSLDAFNLPSRGNRT
jgi:hypothetical protein